MRSADSIENIQPTMINKVTENTKHFSSTSTFTFHSFTQVFIPIGENSLQKEKNLKKKYKYTYIGMYLKISLHIVWLWPGRDGHFTEMTAQKKSDVDSTFTCDQFELYIIYECSKKKKRWVTDLSCSVKLNAGIPPEGTVAKTSHGCTLPS